MKMDTFLIQYLNSGKAWVLVGSGPSIEMGYPTWEKLAVSAIRITGIELPGKNLGPLEKALNQKNYPLVFEEAEKLLGLQRLIYHLQKELQSSQSGKIYELITRWPVPVYLTSNYDNEIHNHLVRSAEAYIPYSNSEEHLSLLYPGFSGGIFKLHGDLTSSKGLILTRNQYFDIDNSEDWQYWRTKLTSIFQMNPVIVIGHSLKDTNIKHILAAAKRGAGIHQPICWIAPDITPEEGREFLEKYRIRVIPYSNKDGTHKNLVRLIENINDFIFPRTSIHIQQQILQVSESPLGENAAAPGFFVFNKLALQEDFERKRIDIMLAILQSTITKLKELNDFTLETALEIAGWPKPVLLDPSFAKKIYEKAIEQELLIPSDSKFKIGNRAETIALDSKRQFEHTRERYKTSLLLRIKRDFPELNEKEALLLSVDIEASLTGFFKTCGLTMVTTLFSGQRTETQITVPSSIIRFISEASARYDDILKRQAFWKISIDSFVRAELAERDYLGKVAQGFFGFHLLGVFGDAAIERMRHAKDTVWLVDSSAQIPALAMGAPTHKTFKSCFSRLASNQVRLFATGKLFDETWEHLIFADNTIKAYGATSPHIIAAATGQAPFRKSNQFLEGFINWQAAGNPCDWNTYLFHIFGNRYPTEKDGISALGKIGIEVIPLCDWPGFIDPDYGELQECTKRIVEKYNTFVDRDLDPMSDPSKKAQPEAEVFMIVKKERQGDYCILSGKGKKSPAWFISHTSILNVIERLPRITWQPQAFLNFTSSLPLGEDMEKADRAFEAILWEIAESGISLLDEKTVLNVFGGIIDQAKLDGIELRQSYEENLAKKYGESIESVLGRISPINRPLATIQLLNEILDAETEKRKEAESLGAAERKKVKHLEEKLKKVDKYLKKIEKKKMKHKRKKSKLSKRKKGNKVIRMCPASTGKA